MMSEADLRAPAISTDTTSPYTAMIPDMTTGIRDYQECSRGESACH